MQRRSTPAEYRQWAKRFKRFGQSGQTVTQFCLEEGVSTPTFYRWRKKLKSQPQAPAKSTERSRKAADSHHFKLVELTATPSAPDLSDAGVTVRIPGGVEITLGRNLAALEQVVHQLLDRHLGRDGGGSC